MKKTKIGIFAPVLCSLLLTGCIGGSGDKEPTPPVVNEVTTVKDYNQMLKAVVYNKINTVVFTTEVEQGEDILIKSVEKTLSTSTNSDGVVAYKTDIITKTRKTIDVSSGDLDEFDVEETSKTVNDSSLNYYLFFNPFLDFFALKKSEVTSVVSLNNEVKVTPNAQLVFNITNDSITIPVSVSSISLDLISKDFHQGLLFSEFEFEGTSSDGTYNISYSVKVGY